MVMQIDDTLLSIPPYISVTWNHVISLHTVQQEGKLLLVVDLVQGSRIVLPPLPDALLEKIFGTHARFLEVTLRKPGGHVEEKGKGFPIPIRIGVEGVESIGNVMQHNPEQANGPDLPPPLLEKVSQIAKALGMSDSAVLSPGEPHCNCPHCQIARALHDKEEKNIEEEEVSEADLQFHEWDIEEKESHLYTVSNPLDRSEEYTVFLGTPIGCNCGKENCEHIRAVLKS